MAAGAVVARQKSALTRSTDDLPEISDIDYFNLVLKLPNHKTETHHDDEIDARAETLGISIPRPLQSDKRNTTSTESASTVTTTYRARTFSSLSDVSVCTALTALSSASESHPGARRVSGSKSDARSPAKAQTFSYYDHYIAKLDPNLDQPKLHKPPATAENNTAHSLFSVKTRRSLFSVKSGLRRKLRRGKTPQQYEPPISCICCRDEFDKSSSVQHLPCGHSYCAKCLVVLVQQAAAEESKMPPRCCTQPIPGNIIEGVLTEDKQQAFLKAVVLFSTPWEQRLFCPNAGCGEFIPPRSKIDPKTPFSVTCHKCKTKACIMCKREAHPVGKDCPEDWELEAVLKMGERSGWRRCYKCRNLVELSQGCTHVTCRCKAQFCYICGGVWDSTLGCPNVCSGEEELERRREEEKEREAQLEEERLAQETADAQRWNQRVEAEERSRAHSSFQTLQHRQHEEMTRFISFQSEAQDAMRQRQLKQKDAVVERHDELEAKMRDRHNKTATHLEDRQVAAEMELRATLEQSERSVKVRLKHMEAYCDGLGCNSDSKMPRRTVTERDLRELGQQYNVRDGMERLHQSKINVMRDRQAKQMDDLVNRQEVELSKLSAKKQDELVDLAAVFTHEADYVNHVFKSRRARLQRRWELEVQILCKEVEAEEKQLYAAIATPSWPSEGGVKTAAAMTTA